MLRKLYIYIFFSYGPLSISFRVFQLQDTNVGLGVQDLVELLSAYSEELKEIVAKYTHVKIKSIQFVSFNLHKIWLIVFTFNFSSKKIMYIWSSRNL